METSLFLAQIMGPVGVITGLAVYLNMKRMKPMVKDLIKSPALIYVSGFALLVLGMFLVLKHNTWERDWTLLITLLSWAILLKGILYVMFPKSVIEMGQDWTKNDAVYRWGSLVWIVLGAYLTYMGYF